MWKIVALVGFVSVALVESRPQGGAESVPFHGYLPAGNVRDVAPLGDGGPNDIYAHLPVRRPRLDDDQVVVYPHSIVFEFGQDPEHKIYEVTSANELRKSFSKQAKDGKHGSFPSSSSRHEEQPNKKSLKPTVVPAAPVHVSSSSSSSYSIPQPAPASPQYPPQPYPYRPARRF